jgi:ribosome-associated protein
MVTRPQPGGIGRDNGVLKTIHRERDGYLAIGALVARAGTVAQGRRADSMSRGAHRRSSGRGRSPSGSGQLLKLVDAVPTGAQVKDVLLTGTVRVNGEPEERRGRQVRRGDVVQVEGMQDVRVG